MCCQRAVSPQTSTLPLLFIDQSLIFCIYLQRIHFRWIWSLYWNIFYFASDMSESFSFLAQVIPKFEWNAGNISILVIDKKMSRWGSGQSLVPTTGGSHSEWT